MKTQTIFWLLLCGWVLLTGCGSESGDGGDSDSDADTDTDSDSNSDADTDTDTDRGTATGRFALLAGRLWRPLQQHEERGAL